jgi:hypothetical protein
MGEPERKQGELSLVVQGLSTLLVSALFKSISHLAPGLLVGVGQYCDREWQRIE